MNIVINNKTIEALDGETILETARKIGYDIPSLCYSKSVNHKSSCMVCAVKNLANGQIIPSCTTVAVEGMQIDTDSDEVQLVRSLSLELLLSDHRADCDALCTAVCPKGLDVEKMLWYYDNEQYEKAHSALNKAFQLPDIGCNDCKAPCEKVCRRGTIDKAVQIREIIREIANMFEPRNENVENLQKPDKNRFQSLLGRFSDNEKERLVETTTTPSRCLHCACSARTDCKLRLYATKQGIKRSRYNATSTLPIMSKMHVKGNIWFEQAKCIRCGLCVYNSENGFTFKDRGFGIQVVLPEENRMNIKDKLVELCPTGALYSAEN